MPIVLSGGELVPWCEWAVNGPQIQQTAVGRRFPLDVLWDVSEGHQSLALGEHRKRPIRQAKNTQTCHGKASLKDLSTAALIRHAMVPLTRILYPATAGPKFIPSAPRTWLSCDRCALARSWLTVR